MTTQKGFFSTIKDWIIPKSAPISMPEIHWPHPVENEILKKETSQPKPSKVDPPMVSNDLLQFASKTLEGWLLAADFGGRVVFLKQEGDALYFEVLESADVGRVIGKDGMTLDAFQVLLKAALYKKFDTGYKVYIDIENYRQKREDSLRAQATKSSRQVLTRSRKVDLKPMNPEERRLIHAMFQEDKRIRSYSVGTGVYRHIVLERRGPAVVLEDIAEEIVSEPSI